MAMQFMLLLSKQKTSAWQDKLFHYGKTKWESSSTLKTEHIYSSLRLCEAESLHQRLEVKVYKI